VTDLHLDCFSGLAGDMFLGACLDLGMPAAVIEQAVEQLRLPGVGVEARKTTRGGFAGTRFRVLLEGRPIEGPDPEEAAEGGEERLAAAVPTAGNHRTGHRHETGAESGTGAGGSRSLAELRRLVDESALPGAVRERTIRLFLRLGEAEGAAHGTQPEAVHFHELGAVDAVVDLVGAAAAVEHLAPGRISCGPVNLGGGSVEAAHGRLPVPAPATARMLPGIPVYGSDGGELLTPTGAVLLAELVDEFVHLPAMTVEAVGYGLGRRETPGRPNAVRLWSGRAVAGRGEVLVVECEVDDLPGEGFGYLMERLLEGGALDVFFTPVQMKKNRPGVLVTLLCRPAALEPVAGLLLAESGSLGCRFHPAARFEAERPIETVRTRFGEVRVKRAAFAGRPLAAAPEFEDCRRLARERGVAWREVHRAALAAAGETPQ
jgi:hypothetical protein